jgi:glycosyltransferase involved in cell wall biosynthesis
VAIPSNNYLFNFSSSYSGGGLIILISYLDLFENKGGATFILNDRLKQTLSDKYKKNKILFVRIEKYKRLWNDEYYLKPILNSNPEFNLYFSYGIPIYSVVGKTNWFHVSNLIPISPSHSHLKGMAMLKMLLLRYRIKKFSRNVDILSADSQDGINQTIDFLGEMNLKTKVLRNGIDSDFSQTKKLNINKDKSAITVGTQKYKDLIRLYKLYLKLKSNGDVDSLKVIGDSSSIPMELKRDPSVNIHGTISHNEVIAELTKSKIYLSTSRIENSSIASLEGLYLCDESYLSEIGSHQELVIDAGIDINSVKFDSLGSFYYVTEEIPIKYIDSISWKKVNEDFYQYLKKIIIDK